MYRALVVFLAAACFGAASPASALCSGASVKEEFRRADVVVRARLVSQMEVFDDEPSPEYRAKWGDGGLVSLYGLKVVEVFKGKPPARLPLFMEHNSGAFYIELDKDYLLFLNYIPLSWNPPSAARGATYVRYACGQSKVWTKVRTKDLAEVRRLSTGR